MTTLEGCNLILTKAGQPPAAALDGNGPGSTSDVAEAQYYLNRETDIILALGWGQNTEDEVEVYPATDKIVVTGTAPFIVGEQLNENVSGAYGILQALVVEGANTLAYIARQGATAFTGGQNLTGESSGNTRLGGALTAVTDKKLRKGTDWLGVVQASSEPKELTERGGLLYDMECRSFVFNGPVRIKIIVKRSLDELSFKLANYCALKAAQMYQQEKKAGAKDNAWIEDALIDAKNEAEDEDATQTRTNSLATRQAFRMAGRRRLDGWYQDERRA